MSKAKTEAAAQKLVDWFPNYDRAQIDGMMNIIGPVLAALPGGELFEDLGYEPNPGISWHEFDMIGKLFVAIDDSVDVEQAGEILFGQDEEDDGDWETFGGSAA